MAPADLSSGDAQEVAGGVSSDLWNPLHEINPLFGFAGGPVEIQCLAKFANRKFAGQLEDALVMPTSGVMIGNVPCHALAIPRHQQAVLGFAEQ
jgi:hypothetical protein